MSDNWTSRRIRKALGVQKCNGSWDAAVEELTMDQVISIAKEKSSDLTGADIRAMTKRSYWNMSINEGLCRWNETEKSHPSNGCRRL